MMVIVPDGFAFVPVLLMVTVAQANRWSQAFKRAPDKVRASALAVPPKTEFPALVTIEFEISAVSFE